MPTLRHLVIFLYMGELIAFAMLYMRSRRPGTPLRDDPAALFCAFMVLRLIVKMVYFYVEFYVLPWHLNILWNSLMDTTYTISLWLALRLACHRIGAGFPRPRLYAVAAVLYVLGFATISYLWVDPASNHLIVIQEGLPQLLYNANEALFLAVAASAAVSVWVAARDAIVRRHVRAICVAVVLYAVYVFLWDVSFNIPGGDVIRSLKPLDGVLFFAAAVAVVLTLWSAGDEAGSADAVTVPAQAEPDLSAFAREHGLTAREGEVLELLFQGMSTTQVADALVISVNTAKRHTYNIYRKANVGNRYELLYKVSHPGESSSMPTSENTSE